MKKKIIALILSMAMTIVGIPLAANANTDITIFNRATTLEEAIAKEGIHILYNEKNVEFSDVEPINNDGRIMIPFRAALETMGAEVNYDAATQLVTAQKGERTVTFTLMDDTIYIDDNGELSIITMDVPMLIVNDRTLVPVRFISNALGLQVGWDQETQTVVISDYEKFKNEIIEISPSIGKFITLERSEFNKSHTDINISLNTEEDSVTLSAAIDGKKENDTVAADITLNVNSSDITIDNSLTSIILNANKLYFKTDLDSKLGVQQDEDYSGYYSVTYDNVIEDTNIHIPRIMANILDLVENLEYLSSVEITENGSCNLSTSIPLLGLGSIDIESNYNSEEQSEKITISSDISLSGMDISINIDNVSEKADTIEAINIPNESLDITSSLTEYL